MKKLAIAIAGITVAFCGGCIADLIGIAASPTNREQKVPAEFKFNDHAKDGLLILVDQSHHSNAEPGLCSGLRDALAVFLVEKVRIKKEYLVPYDDSLVQIEDSFSQPILTEIGAAAGASLILYVRIEDFKLYQAQPRSYYSGSLVTRSLLFDVASGGVLWPESGKERLIRTRVELETAGRIITTGRLVRTTAHCITRSFYDCPKDKFRTADEQPEYNTEKW